MPKSAFQFTQFSESHFHKIEPKLSSVDQDLDKMQLFNSAQSFPERTHTLKNPSSSHCVKVSIVQGGTNSFALISSSHLFRCPFFSSVFFHFFQLFSSYFSHFLPTWATVHLLSDYFGFLCNLWQLEKICTTVKTYKM